MAIQKRFRFIGMLRLNFLREVGQMKTFKIFLKFLALCVLLVICISGYSLIRNGSLPRHYFSGPKIKPDSQIQIMLNRSACFGSCPDYLVILNDGSIEFDGKAHTAALGKHYAKMDTATLHALAQKFVRHEFYSMKAFYHAGRTDMSYNTLTISIDGQSKTVVDYLGEEVWMPHIMKELENDVENLPQVKVLVNGGPELIGRLKEENFDFHSDDAELMLENFINAGDLNSTKQMFELGTNVNPMFSHANDAPLILPERSICEVASQHPEILQYLIQRKVCGN